MARLILALDFGGTKHTAAVAAVDATTWQAHERTASPAGAGADYDMKAMLTLARQVLDGARPVAVGVSFGGPVDYATGTICRSDHVRGWDNAELSRQLSELLEAPAVVDNDANAGALGEHVFGAGQGYDHLLYVTVSTGVGGGWILNGRPWRGTDNMAGEIGHTVVQPDGPLCLCGKRGCVERLASGPFMAAAAREWLHAEPERGALLRELAGQDIDAVDGRLLSKAAAAGDAVARQVLQSGARALGLGIGNAANLVNPQLVLLGGGVTKSGPHWWDTVRATVQETLVAGVTLELAPAALGDDAPLWGAFALGRHLLAGAV